MVRLYCGRGGDPAGIAPGAKEKTLECGPRHAADALAPQERAGTIDAGAVEGRSACRTTTHDHSARCSSLARKNEEAARLLEETVQEEKEADEKLSEIAMSVNEEAEDGEGAAPSRRSSSLSSASKSKHSRR